ALAGTARFLADRGHYRRGEPWGCEVKLPTGRGAASTTRTYQQWQELGVVRADDKPFARPQDHVRLTVPVRGGPALLIRPKVAAVRGCSHAFSYALVVCYLAGRIRGDGPFVRPVPGGERVPTVEEGQEIERRLPVGGFDTGGADGRVGRDTMQAVRAYQRKVG